MMSFLKPHFALALALTFTIQLNTAFVVQTSQRNGHRDVAIRRTVDGTEDFPDIFVDIVGALPEIPIAWGDDGSIKACGRPSDACCTLWDGPDGKGFVRDTVPGVEALHHHDDYKIPGKLDHPKPLKIAFDHQYRKEDYPRRWIQVEISHFLVDGTVEGESYHFELNCDFPNVFTCIDMASLVKSGAVVNEASNLTRGDPYRSAKGWIQSPVPYADEYTEPLEVHPGNFCKIQNSDSRNGFVYDNLWVRFKGDMRNVPVDCEVEKFKACTPGDWFCDPVKHTGHASCYYFDVDRPSFFCPDDGSADCTPEAPPL